MRSALTPVPVSARTVLYNVGTGKGTSVKEFVDACKEVTGANIKVIMQARGRQKAERETSTPNKCRWQPFVQNSGRPGCGDGIRRCRVC